MQDFLIKFVLFKFYLRQQSSLPRTSWNTCRYTFQDDISGSTDSFILERAEIDMISMQHLQQYIKLKSPQMDCQFEVTAEEECGVELAYTTSTFLSNLTVMDADLGGSVSCCLNQSNDDTDQQVNHQNICYQKKNSLAQYTSKNKFPRLLIGF